MPHELYQPLKTTQSTLTIAEPRPQRFLEAFITASQFTPAMGAYTGPGLLGAAFYIDE